MEKGTLRTRCGFTLIEMLVVIAIIALLAALLVPVVGGAIEKAQAMQMAANGRGIHQAVAAVELDHGASSFGRTGSLFPVSSEHAGSTGGLRLENSNQYLAHLVTNEVLDVAWGFFSARDVSPAPGQWTPDNTASVEGFTAERNAWCVVMDIGDGSSGDLFLFSRNLQLEALDSSYTEEQSLDGQLAGAPFGRHRLVYVNRGGSAGQLKGRELLHVNLNPTRIGNPVLRPGPPD